MQHFVVFLASIFYVSAVYHYDYEENQQKTFNATYNDHDNMEPFVPMSKDKEKLMWLKNIPCDDFHAYKNNCTVNAALIHNSNKPTLPIPSKLGDWCKAIKYLTNCAIDWNNDCKDVTDYHFNEESIKGHLHVLNNVCDNEWFIAQYLDLVYCIDSTAEKWEICYMNFRTYADEQKNSTRDWTHFETHFYLCCARAQFRRCTLDALFKTKNNCSHEHAVLLQKYSTIVSEGEVFQDCEFNMMYPNCPGGDPRPSRSILAKLVGAEIPTSASRHAVPSLIVPYLHLFMQILIRFSPRLKEF